MRVITGSVKGFRLKAPKGLKTRPTSDKVKESIFNILGTVKEDSLVLDLFSGSGNIGIEFLSRGAEKCHFVDININSIKVIKENLQKTNFIDNSIIHKKDVIKTIKMLSNSNYVFDYIFLDPPYNKELSIKTIDELDKSNLLSNSGVIIVEHESNTNLSDELDNTFKVDSRKYGDTTISFYKIK